MFYAGWLWLILFHDGWAQALAHWPIAVAMALGSYAAGSTPMGGGTIGFPVLVLGFDMPATLGRDFSFAVQSVGMVSASIFILARRLPLARDMLTGALIGSAVGTPLGIVLIAPVVPELWIKVIFAVVWGSFGLLHFYRIGEIAGHKAMKGFSRTWDFRAGVLVGATSGSLVVAVTGVGIDMVLYTVLVMLCRVDLRVAIPTSIIAMAASSLIGLSVQSFTGGVQPGVYQHWLAAAPVVALGAPLGVLMVEILGRKPILMVVAALCVGQFAWMCLAEFENLGAYGVLAAAAAVCLCLLGFERLRRIGLVLTELRGVATAPKPGETVPKRRSAEG